MKPEKINLDDETIKAFGNGDSFIMVEVEDGEIKIVNNKEEI
jgi:predicted Fe-Mo cluster-binding NifX family protein